MSPRAPLRIGLIGNGGIAGSLRQTLASVEGLRFEITTVLSRRAEEGSVDDLAGLLATQPDVVVECAGHAAVRSFGEDVLRSGVPLLIVSIGALADNGLFMRLREAAVEGGTRMVLAAGAVGGIDALAAARFGGLDRVRYIGRKPPAAWRSSPAESLIDLASVTEPQTFYRGTAREAAVQYPKNSNVAAMIALAGLGFDRTEVELVADPTTARNVHELMFDGADGHFEFLVSGMPSRDNPKTSALTAHSIARLLVGMASPVQI